MEEMKKEEKLSVVVSEKDMFSFQMRNTYLSVPGVIGLLLTLLALYMLVTGFSQGGVIRNVLLIFVVVFYLVVQPVRLWQVSKKQVKQAFQAPLLYSFDEEGITVEQNDQKMTMDWGQILRITRNKTGILIYVTKNRVFILPENQLLGRGNELVAYLNYCKAKYVPKKETQTAPEKTAEGTVSGNPGTSGQLHSIAEIASIHTQDLSEIGEDEEADPAAAETEKSKALRSSEKEKESLEEQGTDET